jgi:hypothetical protein
MDRKWGATLMKRTHTHTENERFYGKKVRRFEMNEERQQHKWLKEAHRDIKISRVKDNGDGKNGGS